MELKHVSQCYRKGEPVLNDVSLRIHAGEFVSVIGPSGAGKTTLLRILNGAVPVQGGEVSVLGTRLDRTRGAAKRKLQQQIGTVYQDFCLVEPYSCLDNVLNGALSELSWVRAMCGIFGRQQRERAMEALRWVGLEEKAGARASTLSGGQKQRAAIARALMQRPKLLLADEPVASLDPASGKQVLELLKTIRDQWGVTVVMNSHNVEAALNYSDRICGMGGGRLLFDRPPGQVDGRLLEELYHGTYENGHSEDRV